MKSRIQKVFGMVSKTENGLCLFCHYRKTSDEDYEPDIPAQVSKRPRTAAGRGDSSGSSSDEPQPSQRGYASRSPRGRGRGRGRGSSRTKAGATTTPPGERWNDVDIPDITPPQPTFRPTNPPGPQLIQTATYTALQLFQLFWTNSVLQTILLNTNEFGSTHHSTPTHPWIDLTLQNMFTFISMVIYMGLVKCSAFNDYWRKDKLHSFPLPKQVMTGKKFLRISRSLHLSSMADDAANEQRRGSLQPSLQDQPSLSGDERSLQKELSPRPGYCH